MNTISRITVPAVRRFKGSAKLTALTAYDFTTARLIDEAGIDVILIGDSLGCVIQGLETTLPVTLSEMIYHCRCVSRAVKHALPVGDLPFLSYQKSPEQAVESAGLLLKEGGVCAVKLEGGVHMAATIERLTNVDIPVIGHVGLTPQSYHRMGGHRIQGKVHFERQAAIAPAGTRERILQDARAVENAGAFAVVLEGIPPDLAGEITSLLSIPTIGIGAGPLCDGQILVINDLLGMNPDFTPRFVKRYADLASTIRSAVSSYVNDVKEGAFPAEEHASKGPQIQTLRA